MRTITAAQQAVLDGSARSEHVKVEIEDSGGNFRDMSSYPGFNAVDSVAWQENVDDPMVTATVRLKREVEKLSISPFMETSAANKAFNPATAYAPLVNIWRQIKISVAVMPADKAPSSGDWVLFFHGFIDKIETASAECIELECRDLGARLADTFMKYEHVYATNSAGLAVRMWEPNTPYELDEYVIPTQSKLNGFYYKVTTAGTTHSTLEPGDPGASSWPTGAGGTVTNGSVVFTRENSTTIGSGRSVESQIDSIFSTNLDTAVNIHVPSSPGWNITWWKQQRESVLDAVRALATQIGWDLRYKWRSATSQFEPTLYEPDRSSPSVVHTFGPSDYNDISSLSLDISGIRNDITVYYSDASDTYPDGTPKRKKVQVEDTTSISDFGRRAMEVSESSLSNIDSETEAEVFAENMLSDLKDPVFEKEVSLCHGFPWVELGDYYTFSANGRHYDTDQDLAVVGYTHELSNGRMKTRIQVRGVPAGGYQRWLDLDVRGNKEDSHATTLMAFPAAPTITTSPVIGGTKIKVGFSPDKAAQFALEWEHHVSATDGFTPDGTSFHSVTKNVEVIIGNLTPGTTYYHRAIPLYRNAAKLVRGAPTAQTSFVASRGQAAHLNNEVEWGGIPLNGAFETQFDPTKPPDHWTLVTGTWGTDADLVTADDATSGASYLEIIATSEETEILSAKFMVTEGALYSGRYSYQNVSGASGLWLVMLYWYDWEDTFISSDALDTIDITDDVGTWVEEHFNPIEAVTGAKFARMAIKKFSTDSINFYIDSVRVVDSTNAVPQPETSQAIPGGTNNWTNYDGTFEEDLYYKDAFGRVWLDGVLKRSSGTPSSDEIMFTLPAGYRPNRRQLFDVMTDTGIGRFDIDTSGNLRWQSGGHGYFSICGKSFRAA
jgi:hypothetical protein